MSPVLLNGLILGWSVAWPPGPINAEMTRRMVLSTKTGGGFWSAWAVGLGACTADFMWAMAVTAGAGPFLNRGNVRFILGIVSLALLLVLAFLFFRSAWKAIRAQTGSVGPDWDNKITGNRGRRRSYLLGLTFALTSPWNIGFWLAVVGGQSTLIKSPSLANSIFLAGSVVLGAMAWGVVLCTGLRLGARIFARPGWQIGTEILSAMVMLWFAVRLASHLIQSN